MTTTLIIQDERGPGYHNERCYSPPMAYSITATNDEDQALLDELRTMARAKGLGISEVVREAFGARIYGTRKAWREATQKVAAP